MKAIIASVLIPISAFSSTNEMSVSEVVRLANGLTEEQTVLAEDIVSNVYREDTNSSFIVRKELTQTQKRFLNLGYQYVRLAAAYVDLEKRISELESEKNERKNRRLEASRKAKEAEEKTKEKVRRAIERMQTGKAIKKNHSSTKGK